MPDPIPANPPEPLKPEPPKLEPDDDLGKKSAAELVEYAKSLRAQNKGLRTERDNLRAEYAKTTEERDALKKQQEEREAEELKTQKKFEELAQREKQRADEIEQKRKDDIASANERFVRAEVRAAAIRAGIHDPADVNTMDISKLTIGDNGAIDGIDEFVAERKTEKPHWFKAESDPNTVPPPLPGRQAPGDPKKPDWRDASDDSFAAELQKLGGGRV